MTEEIEPKYVIFDTDMGSDDAWALQMMIKAEKTMKNIKLLAITTVFGNTTTENVIKNTFRILDGLDRTDIPIYNGAAEALIPGDVRVGTFFGSNGFSGVERWKSNYPNDLKKIIQQKNAVEIIRELIMENPHKISLICLGPLTNIALSVKTYPEIKENLKEIFIMGGNFRGIGNIKPCAEFNFYADPEAAHIVLSSLECPMTILPLECGREEGMTISKDWRFNVLGEVENNNVKLLNEVDQIAFRNRNYFTPFDALLTACILFPEKCIKTKREYHAIVELHGFHTRGQMVLDRSMSNHNVTVIELMHQNAFEEVLLWTAAA